MRTTALTPLLLLALLAGCRDGRMASAVERDSTTLRQREATLASRLGDAPPDSTTPIARWVLPPGLSEISGLALTKDMRLLAHNDEAAVIYEIDYRRGTVVKQFMLGDTPIRDDFEAIAVAGERLFMTTSKGRVFEFREGPDGAQVPFTVHDSGLAKECEFEGLAFDSTDNALLLACKRILTKGLKDFVILYKWSLAGGLKTPPEEIRIPVADVIQGTRFKRITPSDITVDPHTGHYLILASQERSLLTVGKDGSVIGLRSLPPGHPMAEGIAETPDGLLIVSDEATKTPATITLYRVR